MWNRFIIIIIISYIWFSSTLYGSPKTQSSLWVKYGLFGPVFRFQTDSQLSTFSVRTNKYIFVYLLE